MEVYRTKSFKRDFAQLPSSIQKRFEKQLVFFIVNPFHPSLHTKMKSVNAIWEIRVTKNYRFTFCIEGGKCILCRIGIHDILRSP